MRQVVIIGPSGSVSGLVHRGKGLDLTQFGKAEIVRATLIEWDSDKQKWFIKSEPSGEVWTQKKISESLLFSTGREPGAYQWAWFGQWDGVAIGRTSGGRPIKAHCFTPDVRDSVLYFDDYDDAVAVEVSVIQALQLRSAHRKETPALVPVS
jgi:hypothetical protein